MDAIGPVQRQAHMPQIEDDCCQMCRSYLALVARQQTTEVVEMDFHNMRQLIDSAENGCHLCCLILFEIEPDEQQRYLSELDREGEDEIQIVALVSYTITPQIRIAPVPNLRLEEAHEEPGVMNRRQICELRCEILQDERQMNRHRRRVQLSTGSWQTLNDIHYWLRECEGAHSRCAIRQWELTRQLPTRLLEVGSFNTDPTVYLRSSTQISPDAKYATLSHCWGNNMPVRLTQDTLPAFYEGIHVAILPRTFRDAIVLTRALGLNYLWIDTLCIIQGPTGDWAAECALMSSVYRGSFVNIGANASTDSHGGLFCQRSWKSVTPLTGRLTYTPIGWHENPVVLYPHGGANILDRAPLGSRAWVAQERLLSPRTVHFLPHKVVWECDECFASESDVTGSLEGTPYINRRCLARPVSTHGNNTYTGDQFLATWDRIIRFYSGGQLTVATDKLVAISGVARYMQSTLWGDGPVSYHAGHWSYRFELQLTWYPSAFSVGSRAQTYVAPSWSWASYNGEVFMSLGLQSTIWARLIHIEIHPVSDSFGAVVSGFIRMQGPLCRAATTDASLKTLRLLESSIIIECATLAFDETNSREIVRDAAEQETDVVLFGVKQHDDTHGRLFEGLILRLTEHQSGQYQRVGAFQIYDWVPRSIEEQQTQQTLRAIFGGDPEALDQDHFGALRVAFNAMDMPEHFFEQKGDDWYEFTIV